MNSKVNDIILPIKVNINLLILKVIMPGEKRKREQNNSPTGKPDGKIGNSYLLLLSYYVLFLYTVT